MTFFARKRHCPNSSLQPSIHIVDDSKLAHRGTMSAIADCHKLLHGIRLYVISQKHLDELSLGFNQATQVYNAQELKHIF